MLVVLRQSTVSQHINWRHCSAQDRIRRVGHWCRFDVLLDWHQTYRPLVQQWENMHKFGFCYHRLEWEFCCSAGCGIHCTVVWHFIVQHKFEWICYSFILRSRYGIHSNERKTGKCSADGIANEWAKWSQSHAETWKFAINSIQTSNSVEVWSTQNATSAC